MFQHTNTRRTTLSLIIAAGTAFAGSAVLAQDGNRPGNQQQEDREQDRQRDSRYSTQEQLVRNLSFMRSSDLLGADLRNDVNDDMGTIEDIIVNRGTGRIEHVVIREGGFLGMGGSHVALPFEALVINPAEKSVALNVAADAIDGDADRPLPQGWTRLGDGWKDSLNTLDSARMAREQSWGDKTDRDRRNGQPSKRSQQGEKTEISGRITALDRKDMGDEGREWAVATVQTRDGGEKKVVLGPAWHVFGSDQAPIRGDTFQGTVRKGDDSHMLVDRAEINGQEYRFNNDQGEPAWRSDRRTGASSDARRSGALVLLSEVNSRDAKTRQSDWGQIENSIIELQSGKVAFLVLDPDENFLGIADELKVVPWTIVSIGQESVVIDATKEMLTTGESLPEDMRMFTMPSNLQDAYLAYEVEQDEFRPRR
ncbi:MAG: PRC-barrel domain-containing protein [Phycisphaerales bacterium JB060]